MIYLSTFSVQCKSASKPIWESASTDMLRNQSKHMKLSFTKAIESCIIGRIYKIQPILYWVGKYFESCRKRLTTSGGSRGPRGTRLPGPKFLHFHAVFGKNWSNNRLAPHQGLVASLWEILNPSLTAIEFSLNDIH